MLFGAIWPIGGVVFRDVGAGFGAVFETGRGVDFTAYKDDQ